MGGLPKKKWTKSKANQYISRRKACRKLQLSIVCTASIIPTIILAHLLFLQTRLPPTEYPNRTHSEDCVFSKGYTLTIPNANTRKRASERFITTFPISKIYGKSRMSYSLPIICYLHFFFRFASCTKTKCFLSPFPRH